MLLALQYTAYMSFLLNETYSATSEELLAQSENMTNLVKQFKLIDEEKIQARKKEVKHAGI